MSPFLENIFLLLGTIIGAGIFSLPSSLKQAGWIYFILLITGLSFILGKTNVLYREIVESIPEKHQLPGYVRLILGKRLSQLASLLLLFSTFGALLAYLIIGGSFTANVIGTSPWSGSLIFYLSVIVLVIVAGKKIEALDVIFTVLKVVLLVAMILVSFNRLTVFTLRFVPFIGSNPLEAYGAMLFALTGISIIPELKKDKKIKTSIYVTEIVVLICYSLFAIMLFPYLSSGKMAVKNLFFDITGVFTILSPYLMLTWIGYDLMKVDLKIKDGRAMLIVLGVPFVIFLLGMQSFLKVISLTGGVFLGGIALIVTMMYKKKFPHKHRLAIFCIQMIFLIGVILEFWNFLK